MTEPRDSYSPERRTALLFTGTGADGAYHAGAMRALQEAGVKIDVVGGRGIGAMAAVLGAVDGGAQLWDTGGFWRSPARASPPQPASSALAERPKLPPDRFEETTAPGLPGPWQ